MEKSNVTRIALITWSSIFVMGYMNGFARATASDTLGALVTPQTGNVIAIGENLADGNMANLTWNLTLFLGFIIGVILPLFLANIMKNKTTQFIFNWTIFALPYALYPFYASAISKPVAFLILGIASGLGLGFFRQIYHLDINNAMATGNVRFLGIWFGEAFLKRSRTDKKEVFTFCIFFICVFLFGLGAFLARLADGGQPVAGLSLAHLLLIVFCIIPYFFAPKNLVAAKV